MTVLQQRQACQSDLPHPVTVSISSIFEVLVCLRISKQTDVASSASTMLSMTMQWQPCMVRKVWSVQQQSSMLAECEHPCGGLRNVLQCAC